MAEKLVHFDEIRNNNLKSFLLFFMFLLLIAALGVGLGLYIGDIIVGMIITVIIGIIYSVIAWYSGANMIMALSHAKPADRKKYPFLVNTVEGLAIAAGLPAPKIYIINDTALNAFATGRDPDHSAIAVTTGLLDKMNREELEGVIGHEMSHIRNYDIRAMMLAAVMVGIVILISDFMLRSFLWGGGKRSSNREGGSGQIILIVIALVLAILAQLIGEMIKLTISRKREYAADAGSAVLTRNPRSLASALKKIAADPDPLVDTANKATAHLFISTPFRKKKGIMVSLFATHPPIEDRIKRLEAM